MSDRTQFLSTFLWWIGLSSCWSCSVAAPKLPGGVAPESGTPADGRVGLDDAGLSDGTFADARDGDRTRDSATNDVVSDAPTEASSGLLTVRGRVIDTAGGPVPGVALGIGGQTTQSDALGQFTLANVQPPYQLAAVDLVDNTIAIYQGVTREDPTIALQVDRSATYSAPLTATLEGNYQPTPASATETTVVDAFSTFLFQGWPIEPLSTPYTWTHPWRGPPQGP